MLATRIVAAKIEKGKQVIAQLIKDPVIGFASQVKPLRLLTLVRLRARSRRNVSSVTLDKGIVELTSMSKWPTRTVGSISIKQLMVLNAVNSFRNRILSTIRVSFK